MRSNFISIIMFCLTLLPSFGAYSTLFQSTVLSKLRHNLSKLQSNGKALLMMQVQDHQDVKQALLRAPIPLSQRVFLINGWRWHTMSVISDLKRFREVSSELQGRKEYTSEDYERIMGCYNFVYKFNWSALMRVEKEVFFPWLLKILPESIRDYVGKVSQVHAQVDKIGDRLGQACLQLKPSTSFDNRQAIFEDIQVMLEDMVICAAQVQTIQEKTLVPIISAFVSPKDQNRFNRRVIAGLGLVNSQVHLVSMYEAVKNSPLELKAFQAQIPKVAQLTLPIWRSRLYNPKAQYLQ